MKYAFKVTFKKLLTQVIPTLLYNTAFFMGKVEMKQLLKLIESSCQRQSFCLLFLTSRKTLAF